METEEATQGRSIMNLIPKDEINIKKYDNNITTLYKLSNHLEVPIDYIYLEGDHIDNYKYITIKGFINNKVSSGENLEDYYQDIREKFPNLKWREIAIIYYSYIMDLKNALNKESNEEELRKNSNLIRSNRILERINNMFSNIKETNRELGDEIDEIKDINVLKTELSKWSKQYANKLDEQTSDFDKISIAQEDLDEIIGVKYHPMVVESETYVFYPTLKNTNKMPSLEEGVEIFSKAIVSENVLYIQYNTEDGKNLYWIYDDFKKRKINPPSNYLTHISQSTKMNKIYVLYWIGEKNKSSNKNLIKFIYHIDSGEFIIKAPVKEKESKKIKKNLEKSFPNLNFGKSEQIKIEGYFEVEDVSFDMLSYYYMLNTDITHKMYLYVEESKSAFANKRVPNIHYRSLIKKTEDVGSFASVTISFGQLTLEDDDEDVIIPETAEATLPDKDLSGRLRIKVVKADSINVLEQFQIVFSKLLAKYKHLKSEIESTINYLIGTSKESKNEEESEDDKETLESKNTCKSDKIPHILRKKAPDIFISNYSRSCQCGKQPIIIKPDEVEDWRNFTISNRQNVELRQVMPFPPLEAINGEHDDPLLLDPYDSRVRLWIVCPWNDHPYPYPKPSNKLKNRDKFPFIPCCGQKDTISDMNSSYYHYWDENQTVKGPKKINYYMSTMKILIHSGRKAKLDKIFNRLLSGYNTEEDKEIVFKRCGVPVGCNSLIHCVLVAIGDKTYNKLRNDSDREIYASKVREYIAKTINPEIFKQELYDNSLEEIREDLENPEIDFATEKYYRALEEIFDINIFVFTAKSLLERKDNDEELFSLEIPRSKICHIRPYRENRRSVIVLRHWGTEINVLNNPHCELIVSNLEEISDTKKNSNDEETNYIFDTSMTEILYQILSKSYQVYVWSNPDGKIGSENMETRINPFSRIDWESLFSKYKIVGQRIDGYGKLRTLGIKIAENKIIAVFIPPSQPLNLPYLSEIIPVEEKYVLNIFGAPSGIHSKGLFYSVLDYKYGIYIPTIPNNTMTIPEIKEGVKLAKLITDKDLFSITTNYSYNRFLLDIKNGDKRKITPDIPEPPITEEIKINYPVNTMRIAKRNMYYLIQIVTWLRTFEPKVTFDKWWHDWLVSDNKISNEVKDVIMPNVRFPEVSDTSSGIKEMSKIWPQFFKSKIHLYPNLYDKLFAFLRRREETPDIVVRNKIKADIKYINSSYIWEMDFIHSKNMNNRMVFLSTVHIKNWIANEMKKNTKTGTQIIIQRNADSNSSKIFDPIPYIYLDDTTDKIYIIQNVQGGDLEKALNVCNVWNKNTRNIGFSAPPIGIKDIRYISYGISTNNKLVQVIDMSDGEKEYFHVLRYTKEGRYAAMLPLR